MASEQDPDRLLKVKEVARRLSYSDRQVRDWLANGRLKGTKLPTGTWRVRQSELERFQSTSAKGQPQNESMGTTSGAVQLAVEAARHQEVVLDSLMGTQQELDWYRSSFPDVWRLSYRTDSTFGWELLQEQEIGWPGACQHLQTGRPDTWQALQEVKGGLAQYSRRLTELEDACRKRVEKDTEYSPSKVKLNESHFYRSILDEVGKVGPDPGAGDYQQQAVVGGVSVAFGGVDLLWAANRESASYWIERRLKWRSEFIQQCRQELVQLRANIMNAAGDFVNSINEIRVSGNIPGSCDACPGGQFHWGERIERQEADLSKEQKLLLSLLSSRRQLWPSSASRRRPQRNALQKRLHHLGQMYLDSWPAQWSPP
jgi:excisionase family DNA binding protein